MAIKQRSKKPRSSRDKARDARKLEIEANKLSNRVETLDQVVANLQAQVISLDEDISTQVKLIETLTLNGSSQQSIDNAERERVLLTNKRESTATQLQTAKESGQNVKTSQRQSSAITVSSAAAGVTTLASGTYDQTNKNASGSLEYNASAVKSAYFSNRRSFIDRVQSPNNLPASVGQASDLWSTASGSKGMIVTSEQVLKAWNSGSNPAQGSDYFDNHNYGFQFQYNPGTVSMSYFTSPNVDVTMITSGTEMFNLAGVSGSQGSVSFQIIINRVMDMQYYTTSGNLKDGFSGQDIYSVPPTSSTDYQKLYEKGTMYDVEYLLRVLMGTTMNSYLRGEKTADMGWLPAIPVELHLGKSLRYLGTVNSVNLNHMIFDSRMVPLFTTMDIAFARLPDYPPAGTAGGAPGGTPV